MTTIKIKSTEIKKGMTLLLTVEDGCVDTGKTNGKSIEVNVKDVQITTVYLKGRGIGGRKSSTDYGKVIIDTNRGQITISKKIKVTVV